MSWKRLLSAGIVACVLSVPAFAVPTITLTPLPYVAAEGRIKWEVRITQDDATYNDALAVELPLALTPVTPAFVTQLFDAAGDATNGTATSTWYYNETAAGSGTLLWNTTDPPVPATHTQNVGTNPFCPGAGCPADFNLAIAGHQTEGLFIDTAGKRLFAALGSTEGRVGDADAVLAGRQVNTLHVSTLDGRFTWTGAIVGEDGVQYGGLSGNKSSIIRGDMNANLLRNFGDLGAFGTALTNPPGYATSFPGLDRVARGDMNGNGLFNFGDLGAFGSCLTNPITCPANPGSGAGGELGGGASISGGAVPEPSTVALAGLAVLSAIGLFRKKK